jgi:hypothetical protein
VVHFNLKEQLGKKKGKESAQNQDFWFERFKECQGKGSMIWIRE